MKLIDDIQASIGHFDGVPGWMISLLGLGIAAPAIATPSTNSLDFGSIVHGVGVIVGTAALLWPIFRGIVKRSDEKTKEAVDAGVGVISQKAAEALKKQVDVIREELASGQRATQSVTPQLLSINNKLADLGDIREELHATAFTIGQQENRIGKLEKDVNVLHQWKRDTDEWRKVAQANLDRWKKSLIGRIDDEVTPPGGTYVGPTGGKK